MGTSTGAAKARERRAKLGRAAARARRAAYDAERRARDFAADLPALEGLSVNSQPSLTRLDEQKPADFQHVAVNLIANSLPIAALTLSQAMTDKRAPWSVRLTAAIKTLEFGGITAQQPG